MVMKRYSYRSLKPEQVDQIVERLVWQYPSHSYVIDLEEAQSIGLSAEALDQKSEILLTELLQLVHHCYGFKATSSETDKELAHTEDKVKNQGKRRSHAKNQTS